MCCSVSICWILVDDFEDFIFSHFFGDKALKKRWAAVGELGQWDKSRGQEVMVGWGVCMCVKSPELPLFSLRFCPLRAES